MKAGEFLQQIDDAQVVAAIEQAERRTAGEIRVFVSREALGKDDVLVRAAVRFEKLGMAKTRDRNGVLIYFMPQARKFAVLGDHGIHAKVGPSFWDEVAAELHEQLVVGAFTQGIVNAVSKVGELLAQHFPRADDDRNELTNEVGRD